MNRHWPSADLIATDEKARVAVTSRGFASATAEELRTAPARETETTEAEVVDAAAVGEVVGGDVIVSISRPEVEVGLTTSTAVVADVSEAEATAVEALMTSPNVNDWFASVASHAVWSSTAPLTVKHVPGEFTGENDCGPALPAKGKS